jgi:calcineurin-like phosphoesterase
MNVLFVGDVTGPGAAERVAERLPGLRREHGVDLVIANADNGAVTGPAPMGGSGMSPGIVELLLDSGADVVTSGTHAWDSPESEAVLGHPRVLRAHNLPEGGPGRGRIELEVVGEPVTVINLASTPLVPRALPVWESWLGAEKRGAVVVHFVGAPHDARVFAHAVDGEAAAVLGTLGHEATLRTYLLPGGTALVPDVGMVGPLGGIGGFTPERFVAELRGEDASGLPPFGFVEGLAVFDAVLLRLRGERCEEVRRLE